jgi:hypothetical protein
MPLAVRNIVFRARNMVVYVRLVKDKAPYASWAYAQIKEKPRVECMHADWLHPQKQNLSACHGEALLSL